MGGPTQAGQSLNTTEDTGSIEVSVAGIVDSGNSTTVPLGSDEVFTGEPFEILNYGIYFVSVFSDVASSANSLCIEQSHDGVNWDHCDEFAIPANKGKNYSINPFAKWARVEYTNGPDAQTVFRLQAVAKGNSKPSSHRIQDSIVDEDDAELVKAVLTGQKPNEEFVNFQATTAGNFKTSLEELEIAVSEDTKTSLRVANIIADEFGEIFRQLGDNIFQGAPVVVASEHHEIHCGDSYEATDNVTLGNGATRDYLIIVPDEGTVNGINTGVDQSVKLYHFLGKIESQSELSATFYESSDRVAGTAINVFNRNRNSTLVDFLDISHTPTGGTTDGTIIWGPWRIGTGRAGEGAKGRESEFVLKNNTKYILKITNQTVSDNNVNVEFDYYVHPGV